MNKELEQLKKLSLLESEPTVAIFDEIQSLVDKLNAIQSILSDINVKEVKTYESELGTLVSGLQSLTESVNNKDMVVNIPLDQLATQITKVEQAIKAINEVKVSNFPEFPKEMKMTDLQINELLLAINAIPEFPVDKLEQLVKGLEKKIGEIKLEEKESEEFDYDRLDRKFNELVKAVKGISIASIDSNKTSGTLEFNASFSNGLTVVVAGGAKATFIYE